MPPATWERSREEIFDDRKDALLPVEREPADFLESPPDACHQPVALNFRLAEIAEQVAFTRILGSHHPGLQSRPIEIRRGRF